MEVFFLLALALVLVSVSVLFCFVLFLVLTWIDLEVCPQVVQLVVGWLGGWVKWLILKLLIKQAKIERITLRRIYIVVRTLETYYIPTRAPAKSPALAPTGNL